MNQIEISSLDHVILFELQRSRRNDLSFSEIWRVCEKAVPNLTIIDQYTDCVVKLDPKNYPRPFVAQMLQAIKRLESHGMISTFTREAGNKIMKINLTTIGQKHLKESIFTCQSRMGT